MHNAIAGNHQLACLHCAPLAEAAPRFLTGPQLRKHLPALTPGGLLLRTISILQLCLLLSSLTVARSALTPNLDDYEGRRIVSVELVFEGSQQDPIAQAQFLSLLKVTGNSDFSAVRVRDSLQALFDSERVANARVEVVEDAGKTGPIRLRFVIQRQVQIGDVRIELGPVTGAPIST